MCFAVAVCAQETLVIGQVFDKATHEPLANVHVYFRNTKAGTSTSPDGFFMIRTAEEHGRLVVSALGYREVSLKVRQGGQASVELELQEKATALDELWVLPGENPALDIMKNVRANKQHNNVKNNPDLQINIQERTSVFLSDINARHLERRMFKGLRQGVLTAQDSSLLIPLYHSEKTFALQGKQKAMLAADTAQQVLISDEDVSILLGTAEQSVDFYQNTIVLFGRSFVSPLSSVGNSFYKYYLADSAFANRGKQYHIHFKPKNVYAPVFEGTLYIDSMTYAIQRIETTLVGNNKLNFVRNLRVVQQFSEQVGAPFTLQSEQVSTLFDYAIGTQPDSTRILPTVYVMRSVNTRQSNAPNDDFLSTTPLVSDSAAQVAMENLSTSPLVKTVTYAAQTFVTGYAPLGYVDFGALHNFFNINGVEMLRLGVPLRTSEKLMKHVSMEGYGAYGFRDKAWKYMAKVQFTLPTAYRHAFALSYRDDYSLTDQNEFDMLIRENAYHQSGVGFFSSAFDFNSRQYTSARKRELLLNIANEWTPSFETKLALSSGWLNYGNPLEPTLERPYYELPHFAYHSVALTGRFSWRERVVDRYFQRVHIYNHLPVLFAGLEGGNYRINSQDAFAYYAKLNVMLRQKLPLGPAGRLDYVLQAGYILGDVPYPFLQNMLGNESYVYDPYRFNLMHNFEFAADKYVFLHANWNAGGLLFNQIPWVNRWGLRELMSLRVAYGGLRNGHSRVLEFPTGLQTFTLPYAEAGVGIGNILRIASVQFMWRLSYRNVPASPNWGVKFRFDLSN